MKKLFVILVLFSMSKAFALPMIGRLGVGMHNQFYSGDPAISAKFQSSPTLAFGGSLATNFQENNTRLGGAFKVYRIIFDEPQLNFYVSGMLALLNQSTGTESTKTWQIDGSFGTEFHFAGLSSVGFSFEFGMSLVKAGEESLRIRTLGQHVIAAGVHFYL